MPLQVKWTDEDPETGKRRYLCADMFAKEWTFKWKLHRRGDWTKGLVPTKAMWEHVLDSLKRRYQRREGVTDEDIARVAKILKEWQEPPSFEEDQATSADEDAPRESEST